ncbi:helix-turn-helix domain-containing protein [Bacillus sp. ISL-47]|uniref:CdaR family transcriptional regulator n=1 Tax=Bacillus sp. ISL-47 TaxID=2819130 RepID=UPI001BEBFB65|nr:sugar diacid recognition domain-containing protein [Bacillus sp. ISL-47]MBT2686730.1 helix-turn-helix domain-containing protein [Bacillus sp. ISL-47]MBT2706922.1 helix-turn-helix domain-containing protein [Pseudomonas sp. ISL-84]
MLKKVATNIAASTSEIIGYDVIITDETGTIIAASDKDRLGIVHEASIPVIKNKRPLTIRPGYIDHFEGTKPGFTLPIEIHGNIIGTIAITGERRNVEKYGLLVKKHAEIMLREEILVESSLISQQAHQQFIKEILAFEANQSSENLLKTRSFELGFELKPPFICVAVEVLNMDDIIRGFSDSRYHDESLEVRIQRIKLTILKEIQFVFTHKDLSTYMGDDKFIILHKGGDSSHSYGELSAGCKQLVKRLDAKSIKGIIGIGGAADTIPEIKRSNREAWKVIEIGKKHRGTERVFHVNDYQLETLLQSMDPDSMGMLKREMKQLLVSDDWEDLSQTIKAWCDSGFSKVDTAHSLHIHRNTLQNRLEKIEEITGIHKKDFRRMLYLYLGISLMEWKFIGM